MEGDGCHKWRELEERRMNGGGMVRDDTTMIQEWQKANLTAETDTERACLEHQWLPKWKDGDNVMESLDVHLMEGNPSTEISFMGSKDTNHYFEYPDINASYVQNTLESVGPNEMGCKIIRSFCKFGTKS